MENIKISWNEVRDSANEMHQVNQSMVNVLDAAHQEMQSLSETWDSIGSELIHDRFEHFISRFTDETEVIEEYVHFLIHAADSYESLESTIGQNASNFE